MRNLPSSSSNRCPLPMLRFGSPLGLGEPSNHEVPELVLVSTCKCDKITSLFKSFGFEKANLVKSIGFGGLLKLPSLENLNDELALWLYQRFDYPNMCLHLDGGVDLHIRDPDVNLIVDIPFKGTQVHYAHSQSKEIVSTFKGKLFSQNQPPSLTMSFLEHILSKDYESGFSAPEIDAFQIACVLYAMCYFLAPEAKHDFPLPLIKNFVPNVKPSDINWAQLVLWTIGRGASHARSELDDGSKNIRLYGCSLALQVFYLDNLNFGPSTPYHIVLPRASAYSALFMSDLILSDATGKSDDKLTLFGKNQVRSAYDVCYSRGWHLHLNTHLDLLRPSQDDYLSSVQILTEGLQLLDKYAMQVHQLNFGTQGNNQYLCEATKDLYLQFRSSTKDEIHNLSTKGVDLIRRRNINLYLESRDQHVTTFQKRASIGASSNPVPKKAKFSAADTPHGPISPVAPIAPYVSLNQVFSGHTQHVQTHSGNLQGIPPDINVQASGDESSPHSNKKIVTSHSNFPMSPFDLMYNHPDVDWGDKLKCYKWMTDRCLTADQLNRYWIVFTAPKPISIIGHVFQHCLKLNGSFTVDIVDAIMVLWSYLDAKVYNYFQLSDQTHKIWRHFLPASFAEMVIHGLDYLNSSPIKSTFIGNHIWYNVEDCQKMILPVLGIGDTWSCYFWDFKLKTITVLDPLLMSCSPIKVREKHQDVVLQLHKALFDCIQHFFSGWNITNDGWADVYVTDVGQKCRPQNSGLLAVHYARSFCGKKLAFKLKEQHEKTLCEARGEIAFQMFTCPLNQGFKPIDLMASILHEIP